MIKRLSILFFLVFFVSTAYADTYMDLRPGVSTKKDAERVLGKPIREVVRGLRYDYSPEGHDAKRLSLTFRGGAQIIETIEIHFLEPYSKDQLKKMFNLGQTMQARTDQEGKISEFYPDSGIGLHYGGPDDSSPVKYFTHFNLSSFRPEGGHEKVPVPKHSDHGPRTELSPIVLLKDNFDAENGGRGQLNFSSFRNWYVDDGTVDLIGNGFWDFYPEHVLCVDLDGSTSNAGNLVSKTSFELDPGQYMLEFDLAGSPLSGPNVVTVALGSAYKENFTLGMKAPFRTIRREISVSSPVRANLIFEHGGGDNQGLLLDNVSFMKCSGARTPSQETSPIQSQHKRILMDDRFDTENGGRGGLNFSSFRNWSVGDGTVDLIGKGFWDFYPDHVLYVDLDGSTSNAGKLISKNSFELEPGQYVLEFDLAGSPLSGPNVVTVALGSAYKENFTLGMKTPFRTIRREISVSSPVRAYLIFEHGGGDNQGLLLDNVKLYQK